MTLPPPGTHGGDAPSVARALGIDLADVLDLSQSLNPVAPDPVPVLARHVDAVRFYPDVRASTHLLAAAIGIEPERVLLTNGGAEAIALVGAEIGGRVVEPEFGLHPRGGGPLWRSNPHNPSGLLAGPDVQADVWDEAFYPLATGCWTRRDGNVVVGSLTKLFACPGLRVGYVLGEPDLIRRCRVRQPEWSVSTLALSVLPEFLEVVDLSSWSAGVSVLRRDLVDVLAAFDLPVRPSDANWVLVDRGGLREALAPHGVIVRDCTSFGLPSVTRIAVPSTPSLERLADALASCHLPCEAVS